MRNDFRCGSQGPTGIFHSFTPLYASLATRDHLAAIRMDAAGDSSMM